MKNRIPRLLCIAALAVSLASGQHSPERPSEPLTIQAAVNLAARNYPAIRASLAELGAAESGIDLAKTAYLPRAAVRLGVNRATRNNVFGLIFPNGVIPAISVVARSTLTPGLSRATTERMRTGRMCGIAPSGMLE